MSTPSVDTISVVAEMFTRYKGSVVGGTTPVDQIIDRLGFRFEPSPALSSGTVADKFDRVLYKPSTVLSSGGTFDLNMQDGTNWEYSSTSTVSDVLGNVLSLAEIVALLIISESASIGTLEIGATSAGTPANTWTAPFAAAGATAKIKVVKNGYLWLYSQADPAYAVSGSDKILRLTANGGNVTWKGIAFGRSV